MNRKSHTVKRPSNENGKKDNVSGKTEHLAKQTPHKTQYFRRLLGWLHGVVLHL